MQNPATSASEASSSDEDDFIPLGDAAAARAVTDGDKPPWYREESIRRGVPYMTLHNEILDLCDLLMPTAAERERTSITLTYVKGAIREALGAKASVKVFGSQLTGLVTPESDIDCVVFGGAHNAMFRLTSAMHKRQNKGEVSNVQRIGAKVPIVKFLHIATGLQVDVCFEQQSGLDSGAAAKQLMRQMAPVRPLVMVLKAYMCQRRMNETYHGYVGSFLLQLMVVALVQKCGRDAIERGLPAPNNLGFLLDEFFDFYGNKLNYSAVGITILGEGGGGFYNKDEVGWFDEKGPHLLSMQNPHDPATDTAANSYKVDFVQRSFKATSLRLKGAIQREGAAGWSWNGGVLKYVLNPAPYAGRQLPPPVFCTRFFDEDGSSSDEGYYDQESDDEEETVRIKEQLAEKLRSMVEKHGGAGKRKKSPGSKSSRSRDASSSDNDNKDKRKDRQARKRRKATE